MSGQSVIRTESPLTVEYHSSDILFYVFTAALDIILTGTSKHHYY